MRVHELAKEFGISSSKLIEEIKGYGIEVKSHLSGLDDDRVADIRHKHTVAQVAIRLENELQERKKEETVVEEDEWEFTNSEEVDELLVPDVEDIEEFDGVEVDEQLNPVDEMEDGEETIEEKNERRTKEIAEENERVLAREEENKVEQEVIVEKPRGFWSWLKSLFT
tara:strand:+ start:1317 stop:1820 length:504 start_codon:yes stop_codon:yes gene_type:complete